MAPANAQPRSPLQDRSRPRRACALAACVLTTLTACDTTRNTPPRASNRSQPAPWTAMAPGLRIDTDRALIEFDGTVAADCHNPATPDVYLELLVCSPDTREHESLVVTSVTPALIHAALLAVGLEPGRPGDLRTGSTPTGDAVRVTLITDDGPTEVHSDITAWITDAPTRTVTPDAGHVFAGSRIIERQGRPRYDADGTGVIVGLTTFGSEVIAYRPLLSPRADVDEPVWIADPRTVPAIGTPVRVRVSTSQH